MNDHDRDLILGLTDGSLTGDAAASARARIDADPELAAELASQQVVRSGLAALPEVMLTEAERSDLRENLRAQLNLDETALPAAAAAPARRWKLSWQPVVGLGAAAVFVAAVVILPGTLGGSDDAADEAALEATTTMASSSFDSAGAEEGAATTVTSRVLVPEVEDVDGGELLDAVRESETPQDLQRDVEPLVGATSLGLSIADIEACLEELGSRLPDGDKTPLAAEESDEGLIAYFAVTNDGTRSVVTVNLDTCTVVDVDP